jgi:hypothetical protein
VQFFAKLHCNDSLYNVLIIPFAVELILERLPGLYGSTGCVVDDNINVSSSGMLKTRTSSRVKKAPVTKKEDFLW